MAEDGALDSFLSDEEEEEEIDPVTLCPELYEAVKSDDVDKVLELLEMEVPIDETMDKYLPDSENNIKPGTWTMLHWAAFNGSVAVTSALLDAGANTAYKEAKMSALLRAQAGRSISRSPAAICMNTPLHLSASQGHLRVTWLLLQAKYSVDDLDSVGNSPLHIAAAHKRKHIVNCLIEHVSLCHMKNNFHNKPIDLCTDPPTRMLLKAAMSKPVLSGPEREEAQQKHLEELVEIEESIQGVDIDSDAVDIDELEEKIRAGVEFGISEEVAEFGRSLVKEMKLEKKLKKQIADLKSHAPIVTQTLYCTYVNALQQTVASVSALISPPLDSGDGDAGSEPPSAIADMLKTASALCATSHSEYWLKVATSSVANVPCASEDTKEMMGRLQESVEKAELNEADADLVAEGKSVHARLTSELELVRAKASFPTVLLPPSNPEDMSSKELKEYWLEADPEKPVNTGEIKQTREWPLPPEDTGSYVWVPSSAFQDLSSAFSRLSAGIEAGAAAGANGGLLEEAREVLAEKEGEMKKLEEKDAADRGVAVAAAEKLAKKLKKKKKK
mmetsp:Transcript_16234/g.32399  ORF Transcript_16234/g.32399 Transcript_16234/m.32399 type:complete len:559 (+) Transcript_16234:102-1778(+)